MKITITIQGRDLQLDPDEARHLFHQLSEIFEEKLQPQWPNLYPIIQPVIIPIERGPEPWKPNYPTDPFAPPYTITSKATA